MLCSQCGMELKEEGRFCPYCGVARTDAALEPVLPSPALEPVSEPAASGLEPAASGPDLAVAVPEPPAGPVKARREAGAFLVLLILAMALVAAIVTAALCWRQWFPPKEPIQEAPVSAAAPEGLSGDELSQLSKSMVSLYVYDPYFSCIASGSGFLAFADDLILTNFHVVAGAAEVMVWTSDDDYFWVDAVVYADEYEDLALLRLEESTGLPVLSIGDSTGAAVGDKVYALGNPLDLGLTVSSGILSAVRREDGYVDFQITAPISAGSSGGALLNDRGEVIGITYATYDDGQNLNLAIPSEAFQDLDPNQEALDLYDFSFLYASYGNTFENYCAAEANLVEGLDFFLESWNETRRIYRWGEGETDTGLHGVNLNLYRNVLYFLPPERDALCAYDLETGELTENLLLDYPNRAQVTGIQKLFVTDEGFTLLYETAGGGCALMQLDFYGGIVGRLTDRDYSAAILVEGLEAACPLPETNCVRYIPLYDLDYYDVEVDFPMGDRLIYGGGEYLYALDRQDLGIIRRFNMYSEEVQTLQPKNWDGGLFLVHNDVLYYMAGGIWSMPVEGGAAEQVNESCVLTDLNFFLFDGLLGPAETGRIIYLDPDEGALIWSEP